uniref:Uncharacterized protein n=1 Tax=Rhizophora mucronata TaxID=61149 RepID=A0A2P2N9S7_RHIMU
MEKLQKEMLYAITTYSFALLQSRESSIYFISLLRISNGI